MEKQPLPRATIEVISVLIFQGIISVYSMTWWLKLIIMSILGIGAIIVVNRIPKTISLSFKHKVIISLLTVVIWIPISWYPIQEQWKKDHPLPKEQIMLSPTKMDFPTSIGHEPSGDILFHTTYSMTAFNQSNITLYNIWIEFKLHSLQCKDVIVRCISSAKDIDCNNKQQREDTYEIIMRDKDGNNSIYIAIGKMDQNDKYQYEVSLREGATQSYDSGIETSVIKAQKESMPRRESNNNTSSDFMFSNTIPISGELIAVTLFLCNKTGVSKKI